MGGSMNSRSAFAWLAAGARRSRWKAAAAAVLTLGAIGLTTLAAPLASAATGNRATASSAGRASPGPAAPAPASGMTPLMVRRMTAQIPLDAAATRIQHAAATLDARDDGFFQTAVDADRHTLTVYWRGTVPGNIARLIRSLANPQLRISVVPATYDLAQLSDALVKASHLPGFMSGAPQPDGSGISVILAATGPAVAPLQVGVPVHVARSPQRGQFTSTCAPGFAGVTQPALLAPSRCDDRMPGFWGGDVILNNKAGTACSTAFGVHDSSGHGYMVTAAHCSESVDNTPPVNGISFTNGDLTQTMGTSIDAPGPHDDALIATSAGNQYYDGPGITKGDTHNTKLVVGQAGTSKGDWLCESGAFGGVQCNLHVTDVNAMETDPASGITFSGVAYASGPLVIPGDSGGPWFALASQPGTVSARGVTSGRFISPTTGQLEDTFTPMSVVTQDTGVTVNT